TCVDRARTSLRESTAGRPTGRPQNTSVVTSGRSGADDLRLLSLELGVGESAARMELGELLQLRGRVAARSLTGHAHAARGHPTDLDVRHRRSVAHELLGHGLGRLVLANHEIGRLA